ncbi:MAG: hypothetical protein ACRBC3_03945 [Burkholderiaceae bacterium]
MTGRLYLGLLSITIIIAACGGGGAETKGPVSPSCTAEVKSGFAGSSVDPSVNGGEADGGGNDGGIGEGSGDGSVGAGGALGKFRNTRMEVYVGNTLNGVGRTDSLGLATIDVCEDDIDKPHTIALVGIEGAQYFDEAVRRFVDFKPGERISVQVPHMRRKFLGITTFTNAAESLTATAGSHFGQDLKSTSQRAIGKAVADDNETVASILADQLPGSFRSDSNNGLFRITGLPVSLDETTISQADSIPDNDRGRYSAANAGFSVQAGIFLPGEPRPAIIAAKQLASDLSDGKLDMVDAAGCTIATSPEADGSAALSARATKDACSGDVGDRLAYTYESLWRAKTIATSDIASSAGDADLRNIEAQIAEYTTNVQKIIQVNQCRRPNGQACPAPFYPRSDIRQTVKLNSRGKLTIQREAATSFAPGIGWIGGVVRDFSFNDATYVDIRVGSRGQIVAIHKDRKNVTFFPELEPYQVSGTEANSSDARSKMQNSLGQLGNYDVSFTKAIVSAIIPPAERTAPANQGNSLFVTVFSDGSFASTFGAGNIQPMQLPYAISGIAFDKYIPPGYNASYGPQTDLGKYPFDGPRRQFVLTRQGQVRVMLEGNTNSPGVLLNIPGRVIQLAGESRANIYALNSDGQVYWLNADQANHPLHKVFQVDIPSAERICWVARREAVTCKTGRVFRWKEVLRQVQFQPTNSSDANARSITFAPTGIEQAELVELGGQAIWRLNSVDQFYLSSPVDGSFRSEGIRYLPVSGDPFDPTVAGTVNRSLHSSKCNFIDYGDRSGSKPYLHGWQIRRALKSALQQLGQRATHVVSNGHRLDLPGSVRAIDTSHGFNTSLQAETSSQVTAGNPGQSVADSNCQQRSSDAVTELRGNSDPVSPTDQEIAQRGFSPVEFSLTSAVNPLNNANQLVSRDDLPVFKLGGKFAENSSGFFIDINTGTVSGQARPFRPQFAIGIWNDDSKYLLDQGLTGWQFDYAAETAADPLDIYRDERTGANCSQDPARCMLVSLVPRAVFDNPNQFRLCFDMQFNTLVPSRSFRLMCTLHDFDGSYVSIVSLEGWSYPPRSDQRPDSQIDFGFLLSRPG